MCINMWKIHFSIQNLCLVFIYTYIVYLYRIKYYDRANIKYSFICYFNKHIYIYMCIIKNNIHHIYLSICILNKDYIFNIYLVNLIFFSYILLNIY